MAPRRKKMCRSQKTLLDFWKLTPPPTPVAPVPMPNAPLHPTIATNTLANTLADEIDIVPSEPAPLETPCDVGMEDVYDSDEPRTSKRCSQRRVFTSLELSTADANRLDEVENGNENSTRVWRRLRKKIPVSNGDAQGRADGGGRNFVGMDIYNSDSDEENERDVENEPDAENEPDEENDSDEENESDKANELPVQFSRMSTGKLEDKFRLLVMRLVYLVRDEDPAKKLESYFIIADDTFNARIYGLRDEVAGQIQGWGSDFKTDIERFPEINLKSVKGDGYCVACRKLCSAACRIQLDGQIYDPKTLMPKSPTNSNTVSPATYIAGPTCSKRSQIYHRLHHLKWQLFECVKNKVGGSQMQAEAVFDSLEESFINELWNRVESTQSEAERFNRSGTSRQDEDDSAEIPDNSSFDL